MTSRSTLERLRTEFLMRPDVQADIRQLCVEDKMSDLEIVTFLVQNIRKNKYRGFEASIDFDSVLTSKSIGKARINAIPPIQPAQVEIGCGGVRKLPVVPVRRYQSSGAGVSTIQRKPVLAQRNFCPATVRTLTPGQIADNQAKRAMIAASMESGTEGIPLNEIEDGQCRTPKGERAGQMLCCGKSTGSRRSSTCDDCKQDARRTG